MHRLVIFSVVLLALPTAVEAQGVFISVNGGVQVGSNEFTHTFRIPRFLSTLTTDYQVGSGKAFDVGGGVHLFQNLWLGGSLGVVSLGHEASLLVKFQAPVEVTDSLRFTAPLRYNGIEVLDRSEKGYHIHIISVFPISDRLTFSVYGGPSYLVVGQDVVETIEVPDLGPVTIMASNIVGLRDEAWGFNAGVDVELLFTQHVGVGIGVRFTRANVEFENLLLGAITDQREFVQSEAGGALMLAGLRLHFP